MNKHKKHDNLNIVIFILVILLIISAIYFINSSKSSYALPESTTTTTTKTKEYVEAEKVTEEINDISEIPAYDGNAYIVLNNNKPIFNDDAYTTESFELYSDLDSLGRCGVAYANIGKDLMPTETRTSISSVKPSGWQTVKYDNISGKYLYNRCHLIGFQLAGENANPKNLITCTRFMNADTMLKFENEVAEYVKNTNNHVLYRVTPVFEGNNLLATGVQMEASSVEDKCGEICYNVFVYNIQEGIEIDYTNGNSRLKE